MKLEKNMEIKSHLSLEEELWLKNKMQNPLGAENRTDYNMRKSFFDALPDYDDMFVE